MKWKWAQLEQLATEYEAGATIEDLSFSYGISTGTVRRRLREAGATMRAASPRPGSIYNRPTSNTEGHAGGRDPDARIARASLRRWWR